MNNNNKNQQKYNNNNNNKCYVSTTPKTGLDAEQPNSDSHLFRLQDKLWP